MGPQMVNAVLQVADTLAGNVPRRSIERGSVGTIYAWLESRITSLYERTTCVRLLAMVQLRAILLL